MSQQYSEQKFKLIEDEVNKAKGKFDRILAKNKIVIYIIKKK